MDNSKKKKINEYIFPRNLDGFVPGQFELDNAAQMNKQERIFEKDHTGQIRSRKPGDYGNEKIERNDNAIIEKMHNDIQHRVRREVLNELWAANKVNHQGHWYIRLTDVVNIIGDYDELYENESK